MVIAPALAAWCPSSPSPPVTPQRAPDGCGAARCSQSEAQPLGVQPPLPGLKRAASEAADFTAFDRAGLVIIDASGIANFDAKHTLWPTWRRLSQKLTDEVGEHNSGLGIQAADTDEIDEAFERVAGAMASAGASG